MTEPRDTTLTRSPKEWTRKKKRSNHRRATRESGRADKMHARGTMAVVETEDASPSILICAFYMRVE